jgi:hypothetical protein
VAGTVLGKGKIYVSKAGAALGSSSGSVSKAGAALGSSSGRRSTWLALGKFIDNIDKRQVSLKLVLISQKPQSSKGPLSDL